jgi:hypothetical protein
MIPAVAVIALLGSLLGALVAFVPHRRTKLEGDERLLFMAAIMFVLSAIGASALFVGWYASITAMLVGASSLIVLRIGQIERSSRRLLVRAGTETQ